MDVVHLACSLSYIIRVIAARAWSAGQVLAFAAVPVRRVAQVAGNGDAGSNPALAQSMYTRKCGSSRGIPKRVHARLDASGYRREVSRPHYAEVPSGVTA